MQATEELTMLLCILVVDRLFMQVIQVQVLEFPTCITDNHLVLDVIGNSISQMGKNIQKFVGL